MKKKKKRMGFCINIEEEVLPDDPLCSIGMVRILRDRGTKALEKAHSCKDCPEYQEKEIKN